MATTRTRTRTDTKRLVTEYFASLQPARDDLVSFRVPESYVEMTLQTRSALAMHNGTAICTAAPYAPPKRVERDFLLPGIRPRIWTIADVRAWIIEALWCVRHLPNEGAPLKPSDARSGALDVIREGLDGWLAYSTTEPPKLHIRPTAEQLGRMAEVVQIWIPTYLQTPTERIAIAGIANAQDIPRVAAHLGITPGALKELRERCYARIAAKLNERNA